MGNSLGRRLPSTLGTGVRNCLRYHFSSTSFSLDNSFQCPPQTGGYSCGLIAVNTVIEHRVFRDALCFDKNWARLRIQKILDIVHVYNQTEGRNICFHVPVS